MTDLDCITDEPRVEYAPGTPEDEYREAPGLGSTDVRKLDKSIRAWRHYRLEGIDTTDSMTLGTYVHLAVLQPDRFNSEMVDYPDPPEDCEGLSSSKRTLASELADDPAQQAEDLAKTVGVQPSSIESWRTRDDITALAEHIREHGPAPDRDLVEQAAEIRDLVHRHPRIRGGLLDGGDAEASMWWPEDIDGTTYQAKGRVDYLTPAGATDVVVDIKTTSRSVMPGSFDRTVGRRRYHMQASWYWRGLEATRDRTVGHWLFVAIETTKPYHVLVGLLEEDSLLAGERRCMDALRELDAWRRAPEETYDGLDPKTHTIRLKDWEK